ncbi:hypothetical protein CDAR_107431 [Caerostris darwini]|uniref:Uncharacterized protein n=1 Tax=Caerostris darwini TaxID=1538125 RepID=A0AAV4NCX0_9ARAC|nr:hypothetical protein CDAR_107431 [Caerostris darwini]
MKPHPEKCIPEAAVGTSSSPSTEMISTTNGTSEEMRPSTFNASEGCFKPPGFQKVFSCGSPIKYSCVLWLAISMLQRNPNLYWLSFATRRFHRSEVVSRRTQYYERRWHSSNISATLVVHIWGASTVLQVGYR